MGDRASSLDQMDEETPLRLDFTMLVAMERRDAVIAFAQRKFEVPSGANEDDKCLEVV